MAKRKRLTPAQPGYLGADINPAVTEPRSAGLGAAPIAHVAGDTAATAALEEVAGAFQAARKEGRLIEPLPLTAIDETYLVRDRIEQNADDMEALMNSLRTRGQQTPIEVMALPEPREGKTHGLISGWRRLTALRRLHAEDTVSNAAQIKALVVQPDTAQDAYVAMVEENEIRVNLSHYERARIALRAMQEGVYATPREALQGLYGNVTRSKRSKIGSFMQLVETLDDVLQFPTAISEKLGLALVRELTQTPSIAVPLKDRLTAADFSSAAEEMAVLAEVIAASETRAKTETKPSPKRPPAPTHVAVAAGVTMVADPEKSRIELTGAAVSAELIADLTAWLVARDQS